MYSTLLTEIDEAIGLITLNRPERQNALDATLVAELIDALLEFQARPAVRVVVLSASGLAFCAGIDPAWLRHSEAQGEAAGMQALQRDLATRPAFDEAKVQAVRESLAAGTYKVDSEAIASRMLDLDARLAG